MAKLIWRYRYARYLNVVGRMPWAWAWSASADAWRDYGEDDGPIECAIGEMSYWGQ